MKKIETNRRRFIINSGIAAAGVGLLPYWACKPKAAEEAIAVTNGLDAYGIQLYTLRDDMPKDPKGILSQLASFGYTQIEGFEGSQGMFWNMSPGEFKSYIDGLGLSMVASHCNINENFEQKAAQAAEAGMKYLICPWIGPQKNLDGYKKFADQFNASGEICKANGIRFAYHNHAYSFVETEGVMPQDYLMDNTDPGLVDYEMDIYWVVTGKADPIAYLKKYPNRWTLCHVKDRLKDAGPDEAEASCDVGTGAIDFVSILTVARDYGMKYYIVEQERYDNSTPIKSAETDANYLKKFQFAS